MLSSAAMGSALRQCLLGRILPKPASRLHWACRYFTTTTALLKDYKRRRPYQSVIRPLPTSKETYTKTRELAQKTFGLWSLGARDTYERISSGQLDAVEHLKAVAAEKGDVSEAVRISLLAEKQRLQAMSRKQRGQLMQSEKKPFARTVLALIWTDSALWLPIVARDVEVCDELCYFAVAEGLESFVVEWLKVDDDHTDEFETTNDVHWRNTLLRGLVSAHFRLAVNHSADRALTAFFDVVSIADQYKSSRGKTEQSARPHPLASFSSWPASVSIKKQLDTGLYRSTSGDLYERFEKLYRNFEKARRKQKQFAFDCAMLRLNHPTSPSFTEMYEYLKEQVDEANPRSFWEDIATRKQSVQHSLDQTEAYLRRSGRISDAEWVSQIRSPLLAARADPRMHKKSIPASLR